MTDGRVASLACTVLLLWLFFYLLVCSDLKWKKNVVCQHIYITSGIKQLWQLQFVLLISVNVKADKESSNSSSLRVLSWEELQRVTWSGWCPLG